MRTFFTFTKKEFYEQWKNYKIIILLAVLLVFGMTSPLLAKIMPDMISGMDMKGIKMSIPAATVLDSYTQFFKNMSQMCILVVILIFSGNITHELQKGTAVLLFAKGLSRASFIISKFVASVLIWTVGYACSAAVCYGYTVYLFPNQSPKNLLFAMFCFWLFTVFTLALITFMGAAASGSYAPLLLTAGVLIVLLVVNVFPKTTKFSPMAMASYQNELLTGAKTVTDSLLPLLITVGLTAVLVCAAVAVFKQRRL